MACRNLRLPLVALGLSLGRFFPWIGAYAVLADAVTDIEILRLHYAETLKVWRENFQTRRRRHNTIGFVSATTCPRGLTPCVPALVALVFR